MINRKNRTVHKYILSSLLAVMLAGTTAVLCSGPQAEAFGAARTVSATAEPAATVTFLPLEDQTITRIDETNDSGMVRSHFEDSAGNIYSDPAAVSTTTKRLKKAAVLPSRYDLRDHNLVTGIKDQGVTGCCWAFSAIKVIESNCIKNGLFSVKDADFSENHLAWYSYHPSTISSDPTYWDGISSASNSNSSFQPSPFAYGGMSATLPYDNGGSAILANFTLAKWCGAELETSAPFSGNTSSNIASMAYSMAAKSDLRYDSYAHLQNVYNFDEYTVGKQYYYTDTTMITRMKQAVMDYGAMSISFFYNKSYLRTSSNGTAYYQTYYAGEEAVKNANHSVTIVGWDDNFSASNFSRTPSGNGAWLIANSYGTDFGDKGYFWLSYYDQSICDCSSFIMEASDNYDNIYQYDGFGWGTASYADSYNLKSANIFKVESSASQKLRAVSFYTLTDNQPFKIQIYRGVRLAPTDGVLVSSCTTTGTATQNGYHTITLNSPVNLSSGERFSVVVTYIQQETGKKVYVPIEGRDSTDSSMNISYGSKEGQSFLFTKDTIKNANSSIHWLDTALLGYNNICIKAFTDNTMESADALPSVIKTIKLGRSEKYQLSRKYSGYTSNDTSLASVSSTGRVTTYKRGITSVSVTKGNSNFLYRINIKKAPSKITFKSVGKNKKIKKGKHFTLKVKLSSGSASNKLTFHSSHPGIAKVSKKGKVTARRRGKTTITVKTYNGKKAKLKLTVI